MSETSKEKTVGETEVIKIEILMDPGKSIDFIQHLEKQFDQILSRNGFSRMTTSKCNDRAVLRYWQFAVANGPEGSCDFNGREDGAI